MKDLKESPLYEERYHFKERRANVRFFAVAFCLIAFFFGLRLYWINSFGGVQVSGPSMERTLEDQSWLLMRIVDDATEAKRGDVIVVHVEHYPEVIEANKHLSDGEKTKYVIKRLIAVEGDTVRCKNGVLEIKYKGSDEFVIVDEPYASYHGNSSGKEGYSFKAEYVVGKGKMFFLGDNRHNSSDSRFQDGQSRLPDRLYDAKDIVGVVPDWAVENQEILEKIFFRKK